MNNPFLEKPADLRKQWKILRENLSLVSNDDEYLEIVTAWWSQAPIVKSWLDWDHPHDWPDPWELLTSGHFDNSAISLGIAYTLLMCKDMRWSQERVKLALACDAEKTMQHLIVVVDDKWYLNRSYATVEFKNDSLIIQDLYAYDGKTFRSL
jgi:hypothetical protein